MDKFPNNYANNYDAIRDRIFELLKESNLSQKEFADMLNISSQTVTDWKKGKSNSFSGKLGPISAIFHTTPVWLFSGEGEKYISDNELNYRVEQNFNKIRQETIELQDKTIDSLVKAINHLFDISQKHGFRIPVLGSIPAGIPVEAVEDILDWEEIPASWAAGGREYFGLKVKGDSMYPKYLEGDTVILRKQNTCDSGDDCVVMVNGYDATLKQVFLREDGSMEIRPLNPSYPPTTYTTEDIAALPVSIAGVVVELRRKIK